ncbi:MAG: sulfotransferase family protein [Myxococcota bacterium]
MSEAQDVTFDADGLLAAARDATKLDDFGPDGFREPLEMLCRTYDENPFTPQGRKRSRRRLLQLLTTRLRVQAALARHPEVRERAIRRPMVLTGLPRSGTSALFNLLAADPSTRALRLWEAQFPDPLPGHPAGEDDPRRAAVDAWIARGREKNPEFAAIHFTHADSPEECVLLQANTLHGVHEGIEVMMEPYASWYRDQDLGPMYAEYRDLLRLLDWQRPGERWLLTAPAHLWAIDRLIETFPDVSIVWSHRDPRACVASICSMTHTLMASQMEPDARSLGPVVMDFYATSLERGLAARDRADPARFVDVAHDDFVADGLAVARRIYGHFGLDVGDAVRAEFEAHIAANPQGKHGRHEYALSDYGLDESQVLERFAPYIERFAIQVR